MSLECSACEADVRGGHLDSCSRHPDFAVRQNEFMLRVLAACDDWEWDHDSLWWRTGEGGVVTFLVTCNDFFWWATADAEEITPENVGVLEQAFADCVKIDEREDPVRYRARMVAGLLFCARVNGMRPQGAYYEYLPEETWPLFDAAGPEREVGTLNPKLRP